MSSDPDWALHRTFLAVAQEGSFSAAARRLGLTQPTVARHVDALERAVGGALFQRAPRGLTPTDRGAALVPYAEASVDFPLWVVMHEDLRSNPCCRAAFDALVGGLAAGGPVGRCTGAQEGLGAASSRAAASRIAAPRPPR